MAKRPSLSNETFLKSVFSPSKNPTPVGIRRASVKPSTGRKAARVRAYNNMPGKNQEILRRTGMQKDYLSGNASLADAKKKLRLEAVQQHIVKPLKGGTKQQQAIENLTRITGQRPDRPNASLVQPSTIRFNVTNRMTARQVAKAAEFEDYTDLMEAMDSSDSIDAEGYNVYWYK